MNMISTGAFQSEMDASNKEETLVAKLVSAWEKKNAKVARAGGVSLMALSLAACGSDDDDAGTDSGDSGTADTTTVVASPLDLTNDTDTLEGAGTFNAGMVWSPGGNTRTDSLQSEDTITGTGTADSINITSDGGVIAPTFTGIETVNYSISGATAGTLNLSASTGTTSVSLASTAADVTVTGATPGMSVTVKDINDATTDAAVNMKASSVTGSETEASLTVSNVNGGNVNIGSGAAAGTAGTGVETLNLESSGEASVIASLGVAASTFNVTAGSNLTITAFTATGITTIDASDSSATTSMNVAANVNANAFTYTGGTGNDTLIMNSGFAGTDTLNGNAGSDTLSVRPAGTGTGATATDYTVGALNSLSAAVATNWETLDMRSADGGSANTASDFTVDMDHVPGVTAVTMRAGDADNKTVFTLNDLTATQAGALTITHTGSDADTDSEIIVDMKTNGTDTVKLTATTTANTQVVELNDANNDIENAEITLAGAFTTNLDIDVSSFGTSITLSGGSSGLATTLANNMAATTFDASGFDGNLASFTTSGTTQTINGGSGADTVVLNAGVKTVDMNGGNDTVSTTVALLGTATTSWDTIDAGDGTDTLLLTSMAAVTAEAANGLSGFERLKMDAAVDPTANVTINLANFVNNADLTRITIGDTHNDVLTISSVGSAFTDLRFDADAETDTEATIERLVDSTSNNITVTITGSETIKTLTMNDEEEVTLTSTNGNAATITTLSATDMTTLTAIGSGNVIISNAVTGTAVTSVDVSGLAAAATINVSNATGVVTTTANNLNGGVFTFTGGSGADVINGGLAADDLTGGAGTDTISGGAGADRIDSGLGADIVTGGTGSDTYEYGTPNTNQGGGDKLQDFAAGTGGDEIEVNTAGAATVALVEMTSASQTAKEADDGDVFVITGGTVINTQGAEATVLAALNAAIGDSGQDHAEKNAECLVVVNGDTDGDGAADAIQVFYLHETGGTTAGTAFDEVEHIADLTNIAAATDLASDFVATNFDFT